VISAPAGAPRYGEASIADMGRGRYDGLADEYDAFVSSGAEYYAVAADALRRLLGHGDGRCLDVGCGGGHFFAVALELGWRITGVDASADQLRVARERFPDVELVKADAVSLPFADGAFDAACSTFTHTDVDDFAGAIAEVRRVLRPGGRFAYVGNHPCFVGPVQEYVRPALPRLHAGYRRAGRWQAADAPGTTPGGWRARLGSFVHLPLAEFLSAFAGFAIERVEEPDEGSEYPTMIALALVKTSGAPDLLASRA
jgi:SAM-dependent methyltransferase